MTFHFECHYIMWTIHFVWHSMLSNIPFWVTFHYKWHSILSDILFWVIFHFEWHSFLSDSPFGVTFHFEWHSILSDIPFWVKFHFEWHSVLSDNLNLNEENWCGIGPSITNRRVNQCTVMQEARKGYFVNIMLRRLKCCQNVPTMSTYGNPNGIWNRMIG